MQRVRTKHFVVTGAIGGLVGFFLMEEVRQMVSGGQGGLTTIWASALRFAAFGLAVGAALGVTEALVQRKFLRLLYGLLLGLVLGTLGGFGGGAVGETIFQLLPQTPRPDPRGVDLAIALDASGSMKQEAFFGLFKQGNDREGKRREAAQKLVDMLGPADRVSIVSFSDAAQTLLPLTSLDASGARGRVKRAISGVGNEGGTNLSAGLHAALAQLTAQSTNQSQHVIFLTDGVGDYQETVIQPALDEQIKIYTIGLGSGVNQPLMEGIAQKTGGAYYPVDNAGKLWQTFEKIYKEEIQIDMAGEAQGDSHNPLLLFLFRMLSWGAMGVVIGIGQGIRENTREDLLACSIGGLLGGLVGGAAFDPISSMLSFGGGIAGRALADITVGACIGGSMRFAQSLVVLENKPTSSLISILPEKSSSLVMQPTTNLESRPGGQLRATGMKGLVLNVKELIEGDTAATPPRSAMSTPPPVPSAHEGPPRPAPTGRRKPLSFFQSRFPASRPQAMAAAFESGHYSLAEIAEFFNVPEARVRRAIESSH